MPKVSVIVPVYNAEAHLAHGFDSILAQSLQDFELILVDDGSRDQSGAICDEYSRRDSRVTVIHQKNAGVSAARNAGLKAASGEWVTFVDSDDLVLDCFLQSLVDAVAADEQIDLAYCGYAIVDSSVALKSFRSANYIGKEQIHDVLSQTNLLFRCSPWAKLFRRSIIVENGLCFDTNLSISEDRLFMYQYLVHVNGIATTATIGYLYGSFSPTSLKHKQVPTEMLAYRQRSITDAAHGLVRRFELGVGDAYLIARHLVLILFELIRNVYDDFGVSRKTVESQQKLFNELFDTELYKNNLENDHRWQDQLSANELLRYMIEQRFPKLNRALLRNEMDLKLRVIAHNLFKKDDDATSSSFEKMLSILNKKEVK